MKNELLERKWQKLLGRICLFRFVPFLDFVLVAGSMATGNVHEDSDFDVIVGVREGRIFTSRFFSWLLFGLLGWRRKKLTHGEPAKDKICLNHFVAPKGYKLKPPYNIYWQELYQNLVPVLGSKEKINEFFVSNKWLKPRREYKNRDQRHLFGNKLFLTKAIEYPLLTPLGDWLERKLRDIQVKKIEAGLEKSLGYKPRIIYNDDELEFHPDTKRIEMIVAGKQENQKGLR